MMLVPPAPRSPQVLSSIAVRSGTKLVSHMWLPGRTVMRSPSPEKYSFLPARSEKSKSAAEHEGFVVEDIHHHRQVRRGDEQRALGAAAVEVPVFGIERNGEQALGAPFETALRSVGHFDLGRAMAVEHIDDLFVEVPLRRRRAAGRDVEHEHVGKIAAALEMHRRAVNAVARPWRGLDVEQVDAVILDDRNGFALEPIEIRVDAVARLLLRQFADIHVFLRASFAVHHIRPVIIREGG